MIVDLISPWIAAIHADAASGFFSRHAVLLEAVRAERDPLATSLALCTDIRTLDRLARRTEPSHRDQWQHDLNALAAMGISGCAQAILLAGAGPGPIDTIVPAQRAVALFLDRSSDDDLVRTALASGATRLTRWRIGTGDAGMPLHWHAARVMPLREWIYTAGLALHAAQALMPALPPHRLLGVAPHAYRRLRQREKLLRAALLQDLDQSGLGLVLRWMTPDAPISARTARGVVIPPGAGHYLAWRMVAARVERIGLAAAMAGAA